VQGEAWVWIKRALTARSATWIANWNDEPKPYVWHTSADEILDSLAAYCQRSMTRLLGVTSEVISSISDKETSIFIL
jgi:hypothetical protein